MPTKRPPERTTYKGVDIILGSVASGKTGDKYNYYIVYGLGKFSSIAAAKRAITADQKENPPIKRKKSRARKIG